MPGILPDSTSGALVIRDGVVCTPQQNVLNAFCPPPAYAANCDITALPSTCDARITAAQINAIVSELMALAVCFDRNGPWNCNSITNLCAHFNTWVATNMAPTVLLNAICADALARALLVNCVISADAENAMFISPGDGGLYVPSHVLFGARTFAYPDVDPVPDTGGAGLSVGFNTFTIPNSSPYPITVMLENSFHAQLDVVDGNGLTAFFNIRQGPGIVGPIVGNVPHIFAGKNLAPALGPALRDVHDSSNVAGFPITVLPGGLTLTSQLVVALTGAAAGPMTNRIVDPTHFISWHGVHGQSFN